MKLLSYDNVKTFSDNVDNLDLGQKQYVRGVLFRLEDFRN